MTSAAGSANIDGADVLPPGHYAFITGMARVPQHIHGPVMCDIREDIHRIRIGDPDAGGVELGLSLDDSSLKYVDLGNRGGVYFAFFSDGDDVDGTSDRHIPDGAVRRAGDTYLASGWATGTSSSQHSTRLYFEISVACP